MVEFAILPAFSQPCLRVIIEEAKHELESNLQYTVREVVRAHIAAKRDSITASSFDLVNNSLRLSLIQADAAELNI